MNPIEISCYYEALDDMFAFPSSPVEVPAFSQEQQYEEYLGVYDQKEFSGKFSHAREIRHSQRPCPLAPSRHSKNVQADCYAPYQAVPLSFAPPSRVKSTTPNLNLLFSLFEVLEDDGYECNSNTSSPSSGSEYSEVASSPACVPSHDASSPRVVPHALPQGPFMELSSHKWAPQAVPFAAFYPDRTPLLSNLADLN